MDEDLSEARDLAAAMPERVKELNAKLLAWLEQTRAKALTY